MGNLFTAMERKIIEMSEEVCREALKSAAYEIQQDIKNNICYRIVDDYYEEYTPTKYKRMDSLYNAWGMSASLVGDRLHFYPDLDSDRLPQHHSGSKFHKSDTGSEIKWKSRFDHEDFNFDGDDNGRPDNAWILDNFFEGIHPRFFTKHEMLFDNSFQGSGVLKSMSKYVKLYKKSGNMIDILAKHLKQACKTYNG